MKNLIKTRLDLNEVATWFYNVYCNASKCPKCPFKKKEHDCFASWLDDIYSDLENVENRIKETIED